MTRLRDDGFLETDDPVVASCFYGKTVLLRRSDYPDDDPIEGEFYEYLHNELPFHVAAENSTQEGDSILIPAQTVAEVCGWTLKMFTVEGHSKLSDAFWHLAIAIEEPDDDDGDHQINNWLRTHTGGNDG